MENEEQIETNSEVQVVPDGYYTDMLDSVAFNNFALSLLLGILIIYLMITGMRR